MTGITTLILCYIEKDAQWAIQYLQNHSDEKVIILSSTIDVELFLKSKGLPYLLWFEVDSFEPSKLLKYPANNIYRQADNLVLFFTKKTVNLNLTVSGINIFSLFRNNLSYIYADILHCHKIYKKILSKWHPNKIYIPYPFHQSYITGSGSFFSLAYYIDKYFKDDSLKVIPYQAKVKNDYSTTVFNSIRQKLLLIKYPLLKIFYSLTNIEYLNKVNPTSKKTILMETGGIITSYYYKFYKLLSRKYNFLLITYKLQLHQQIPLIQRKIPYINFDSCWKSTYSNEFNLLKNKFINKISKLNQFKDSTFLDNKTLQRAAIEQTLTFLQKNIEQILKKIIINKKILNEYQPNLAINSHDPSPTGLSLVLPAKQLGIPTLLLLHGIPMGKYHPKISSDFIITWGKSTGEFFLKYSDFNRKALSMSGFTLFDNYQDNLNKLRKNSNKPIYLSNNLKLGILLTSYHPNNAYQAKFFHELLSSLGKLNIKIICNYRFHEGFTIDGIEKLGKEYGININNKSLQNLDEFINLNDIIICWDTTAILWAMLYQKPLFHTSPIWGQGVLPTQKYKAAWIPKNANDLSGKIKQFIKDPNIYKELLPGQKKFLEDYAGPLDGKSSERLFNYIDKLVKA